MLINALNHTSQRHLWRKIQTTIPAIHGVSKPVFRRQLDDGGSALQRVQRKICPCVSSQAVHQHHLGQTRLQADASTLMNLWHTVVLAVMKTGVRWQGAMQNLLASHVMSHPSQSRRE